MLPIESFESVLFSTAYLPPVEYIAIFLKATSPCLEIHEHFVRRSYANRCFIANVNGLQSLTIPVSKTIPNHCPIKEMKIDYAENWQRSHWKSLETAYNTSPFFLFYRDYFEGFYAKSYPFLLDFTVDLFELICCLLKIEKKFNFTDSYVKNTASLCCDLREKISPVNRKLVDYRFAAMQPYRQVFIEKNGFIPNLSIVDLLFNKGNQTLGYLEQISVSIE